MRRPGLLISRIPRRRTATVLAAVLVLAGLTAAAGPVDAVPDAVPALQSVDAHAARDKDNRVGTASPSALQSLRATQLGAGVRWNAFGTPHAITTTTGTLAAGLSSDPATAARQYIAAHRDLFGLDEAAVAQLDTLLVSPIGTGAAVLLRQRFGDLPAGYDGQVSVLVNNGTVVHVSSSLSRDTSTPAPATISVAEATTAALRDAGIPADQGEADDVTLVAVPMPGGAPRTAYAVTLHSDNLTELTAYTTYVDARTADILVREDLVDFDSDNPTWAVFPSTAPLTGTDSREIWCLSPISGCVRTVADANTGQAWDQNLATGTPTFTSRGNSANNVVNWGAGNPAFPATTSPTRTYQYPFTDQWHQSKCDPTVYTSAQRNDADAAVSNLFAMHNRMHDWSYRLGFTEAAWNMQAVNISGAGLGNDAEQGRAQAGARSGSRNNANQGTGRDGLQPTTNMFLWQPIAGSAYPPCVDGDFDMTVIGHEYTHAITNRMIAGPNSGIGSFQGGAMGESWGDMMAAEYQIEYGFRSPGETPFITGGYVTGNLRNGIRNYDMSRSPLNYSDVGYDRSGPGVHADGEIWSATNMRIRSAFLARYGSGTPALQAQCADGLVAVTACPGNRRWVQIVFDSFLLQASSQFTMLDMRDNMLAADLVRFGGANQDILWNGFAESGMGQDAASEPNSDEVTPSFASPFANNATVQLHPIGQSQDAILRVYVGDYEARATPIADTDPATALGDTFSIIPGRTFQFIAVGAGYGFTKFTDSFAAGTSTPMNLNLPVNLASTASGATISGPGVNLSALGDDSEATNWASLDGVAGRTLTIDLPGDAAQHVKEVRVSAMLRPPLPGTADPDAQGSLTALRSFEVLACNGSNAECSLDANYHSVYVSAPDAFPAGGFRAFTQDMTLRSFGIQPTMATHLRLRVLASQCTGGPLYAGEQDNDPNNATDCATNSPARDQVRIAEFQAFSK